MFTSLCFPCLDEERVSLWPHTNLRLELHFHRHAFGSGPCLLIDRECDHTNFCFFLAFALLHCQFDPFCSFSQNRSGHRGRRGLRVRFLAEVVQSFVSGTVECQLQAFVPATVQKPWYAMTSLAQYPPVSDLCATKQYTSTGDQVLSVIYTGHGNVVPVFFFFFFFFFARHFSLFLQNKVGWAVFVVEAQRRNFALCILKGVCNSISMWEGGGGIVFSALYLAQLESH